MASHRFTLVRPQCSTQFPWSILLLAEVCSDMHAVLSGLLGADFTAGELVPAASLDARTSCCISVSSMSRPLPVAFVTGVGVSFDSSFSLHSLVMSSTCLLFDFHSDPCRLQLIPLHELHFPVISPLYHVGLIRGMVFVSKCVTRTHPVSLDSASLPLEGKLIPR